MSDDNKQDAAEPSPASTGSVAKPYAWVTVTLDEKFFTTSGRDAALWREDGLEVTPLYRQPQTRAEFASLRLTREEREAVEAAAAAFDASDYPDANRKADTLRGLLERTK